MNTLVLSGGALNGFSTLGAVQFLLDNKIIETKNIRKYIGTSSGSMISYLLAIGYTPVEIFIFLCQNKLFKNVKQFDFLSLVKGTGYVNFKDIHNILEVLTMKKIDYIPTLHELHEIFDVELIIPTYDLTSQKRIYLSHKSHPELCCLKAIQMSSSLPFVFDSCVYKDHVYIDGFFTNNFAINQISEKDKYVGVCILQNRSKEQKHRTSVLYKIADLFNCMVQSNTLTQYEKEKEKDNIYLLKSSSTGLNFSIKNEEKNRLFCDGYRKIETLYFNRS